MNGGVVLAFLLLLGAPPDRPAARDGQHDFDFEFGTWKTHLSRLLHPLTGSKTWVEYEGTTVVRPVANGRANLVELVADGPAGHSRRTRAASSRRSPTTVARRGK
jgi:hypothetical protein